MDFSIIAVLFLVFSVINSILSGQKQKNQKTRHENHNQIPPLFKNIVNMIQTELELDKEAEGVPLADRGKVDNIDYVQMDSFHEELQLKPVKQDLFVKHEDFEETEYKIEEEFDFHDIRRSIVLAEVLGPPRALKRNIR